MNSGATSRASQPVQLFLAHHILLSLLIIACGSQLLFPLRIPQAANATLGRGLFNSNPFISLLMQGGGGGGGMQPISINNDNVIAQQKSLSSPRYPSSSPFGSIYHHNGNASPQSQILRKSFSWGNSRLPPPISIDGRHVFNMMSSRRSPLTGGISPSSLDGRGGGAHEWWHTPQYPSRTTNNYNPFAPSTHSPPPTSSSTPASENHDHHHQQQQYPPEVAALITDVREDGALGGDAIRDVVSNVVMDNDDVPKRHDDFSVVIDTTVPSTTSPGDVAMTSSATERDSEQPPTTTTTISPLVVYDDYSVEIDDGGAVKRQVATKPPPNNNHSAVESNLVDTESGNHDGDDDELVECHCETARDLVCGNDGVTYWNKCTLRCERKRIRKQKPWLQIESRGACAGPSAPTAQQQQQDALTSTTNTDGHEQQPPLTIVTASPLFTSADSGTSSTNRGHVSFAPVDAAADDADETVVEKPEDEHEATDGENTNTGVSIAATDKSAMQSRGEPAKNITVDKRRPAPAVHEICNWSCRSVHDDGPGICDSDGNRHASECEFWRSVCRSFRRDVRQVPRRVACIVSKHHTQQQRQRPNDAIAESDRQQQLVVAQSTLRPLVADSAGNIFNTIETLSANSAHHQNTGHKFDSAHKLTRSIKINPAKLTSRSSKTSFAAENLKWKRMFVAKTVPTVAGTTEEQQQNQKATSPTVTPNQMLLPFQRTFDDETVTASSTAAGGGGRGVQRRQTKRNAETSSTSNNRPNHELVEHLKHIFQGWKRLRDNVQKSDNARHAVKLSFS